MGDDYDTSRTTKKQSQNVRVIERSTRQKAVLMEEYFSKGTNVYYARQLEIWPGETVLPLDHGTRPS
jgi:hypothetical protein